MQPPIGSRLSPSGPKNSQVLPNIGEDATFASATNLTSPEASCYVQVIGNVLRISGQLLITASGAGAKSVEMSAPVSDGSITLRALSGFCSTYDGAGVTYPGTADGSITPTPSPSGLAEVAFLLGTLGAAAAGSFTVDYQVEYEILATA